MLYDIQLVDPRDYGDKSTAYLPEFWSSDNPDVIKINFLRGKVTRPALGQPDAKIKLTITAAKGGYSESKEFTVTVKAVTQAELDTANAELDVYKRQVLMLQPKVLLLDEPTAQLDPVSAQELLSMLKRLNQELAMTIIISEHRLEALFPLADRVVLLDQGCIRYHGPPRNVSYAVVNNHCLLYTSRCV